MSSKTYIRTVRGEIDDLALRFSRRTFETSHQVDFAAHGDKELGVRIDFRYAS
jgi:hypothetical protein